MTEAQIAQLLLPNPIEEDFAGGLAGGITGGSGMSGGRGGNMVASGNPASDKLDPKIKTLANRIFLQVYSVPSLQACLADASVNPTGDPDGSVKIQLDFLKLPKEVLPDLERLLSTDFYKNHKLVKYIKNGQARTGLEIQVTPKELPGTEYDYAY